MGKSFGEFLSDHLGRQWKPNISFYNKHKIERPEKNIYWKNTLQIFFASNNFDMDYYFMHRKIVTKTSTMYKCIYIQNGKFLKA